MTNTETKLTSINAALAERAERLRYVETCGRGAFDAGAYMGWERDALKAQIRDLETEKHALLQTVAL